MVDEDGPWLFNGIEPAKLILNFKTKTLTYSLHGIKNVPNQQAFAFGEKTRKKLMKAKAEEKVSFEIQKFPAGQPGRESEHYWFIIPDQVFGRILKPEWQGKLNKKVISKDRDTRLSAVISPIVLEQLKLRPDTKFGNFLDWPLKGLAKLFDYSSEFNPGTWGSVIEIINVWYESVLDGLEEGKTKRQGVLTNEVTGLFFGVSPGLPQLIVNNSEDLVADGALFEHMVFSFATFTYDDDGRVVPNDISSPLPKYPKREVASPPPYVIKETDGASQQIRKILCNDEGELDIEQLPLSLVTLKGGSGARWLADGQSFTQIVEKLSEKLKFDCLFEPEGNQHRWPNVYSKVFQWCLIYKKEDAPECVPFEKETHYTKGFPIYLDAKHNLKGKKMGFCWFKSARGRVHDLALIEVMNEWKSNEDYNTRWLLLGDETGQGKELIKGKIPPKNNKNFAYIWVLIPPKCFPPSVASDFHGMDQHQFGEEHLRVLSNLMKDENLGIKTLIFETTNHLESDEILPEGNEHASPSLVQASLPIVLEYVKQHTPTSGNGEYVIKTITEEYGWWERQTETQFINGMGQRFCDFFSTTEKSRFKFDKVKIVGKLDHPWLNYADAIGFLTSDTIPKKLKEHKYAIEESIQMVPIYLPFMQDDFPSLSASLASNPLKFVDQLLLINSVYIRAYFEPVLRGMLNQAFERFSALDWRQFNNIMVEKQNQPAGRIVSRQFVEWAEPNYQKLLDSLESDLDRINMCLTQAWSMDQQGGDVTSKISFLKREWLKPSTCPEMYWNRIHAVVFASRQNSFDFETKTPMLIQLGIKDWEILTPQQLDDALEESSILKEETMKRFGIVFSTLAFKNINGEEELMWKANQRLVDYPWSGAESNRRHCIYGAEFAMDQIATGQKWLERAYSRLHEDFDRYLSTGEDRRDEQFWWPVALKYWTFATDTDPACSSKTKIEEMLKKAARFASDGLPIVRVRTLYWMARLGEMYQLNNFDDCFDKLVAIAEDQDYLKNDVYGALLYVHLIDLDERRNTTDHSTYRDDFKVALAGSRATTQAHFEKYMINESLPILDSLTFNYL